MTRILALATEAGVPEAAGGRALRVVVCDAQVSTLPCR
jgi:hypothetical protein